jgi:tRNA(Ile)-lysidine synthase
VFSLDVFERELVALLGRLPPRSGGALDPGLCVALSGGLDSTVLVAALGRLAAAGRLHYPLRAAHVDHALHADSAQWSAHCARLCAGLGIACDLLRVTVARGTGASLEEAARDARYAALAGLLRPGEVLLTAHHADDQLESVLLQMLRGGGLAAASGMAPLAPFGGHAWHGRPLLACTRAELAAWAADENLAWLEDPSNRDLRFDRNYLRQAVLPPLRERWPAAARAVGRSADYARDALALEQEVAGRDLLPALRGVALDLATLQALPEVRQRGALRLWLRGLGLAAPSRAVLEALRRDALRAAPDRNPVTRWPGAAVHRYRGCLHAVAGPAAAAAEGDDADGAVLDARGGALPWHGGSLRLVEAQGEGIARAGVAGTLRVSGRRDGERFVPAGAAHHRELRKWLQERGVLPWRRAGLPVFRSEGGQLVAVADLALAAGHAAAPGEPSWRLEWQGRGIVTEADAFAGKWSLHPPIR